MDQALKLAREHCRDLLTENLGLHSNLDFLFTLAELQRQIAVLEGRDYGIIPFDEHLPPELMQDAMNKLVARYKELAPPPAKEGTNDQLTAAAPA